MKKHAFQQKIQRYHFINVTTILGNNELSETMIFAEDLCTFRYDNCLDKNFCLSRKDLNYGKIEKSITETKKRINFNRILNKWINTTVMTLHCKNREYDIHKIDLLSSSVSQPCILENGITIDLFK